MRITRKNIKHKRSNKIKKTTKVHKRHSINKNSKNKNKNKKTKRGGGLVQSHIPSPEYEEREIKGYVLITDAEKIKKNEYDIQIGDIILSKDNKFIAEISKINYQYDNYGIQYIYSFSLGRILHNTSEIKPETALYTNYNNTWIAISPKEYKNLLNLQIERKFNGNVLIDDAIKVAKQLKDIQVGDILVSIGNRVIAKISGETANGKEYSLENILHNTNKQVPKYAKKDNYNKKWIAISNADYQSLLEKAPPAYTYNNIYEGYTHNGTTPPNTLYSNLPKYEENPPSPPSPPSPHYSTLQNTHRAHRAL